jgi:hypothetical protein
VYYIPLIYIIFFNNNFPRFSILRGASQFPSILHVMSEEEEEEEEEDYM